MAKNILVLFGLIILSSCQSQHHEISVLFPSTEGIRKGTPAKWNGVSIGKVSHITPTKKGVLVVININSKYREDMVVSSTFLLTGPSEHRILEYHILNPNSPPLKEEILQGVVSMPELLILKLKELSAKELEKINDYLKQLNRNIKEYRESKEHKEMIENIINTMEEALKLGKEMMLTIREKIMELCRKEDKS